MPALREKLDKLATRVPMPCLVGLEPTLFTAWVYDRLISKGIPVKVAHPSMLKAIFAGKLKNDEIDARKLADLLRCNYFPERHIAVVKYATAGECCDTATCSYDKVLRPRTKWLECSWKLAFKQKAVAQQQEAFRRVTRLKGAFDARRTSRLTSTGSERN